jgi:transposase InsO family protein
VSRGLVCAFIATEKTTYGVRRLCRVLAISPTTFYTWASRAGGPTRAELADAYAINDLHTAWVEHRRTSGAPRLPRSSTAAVGWAMADHLRTELVLDAVGIAIRTRRPDPGLVHHTDRFPVHRQ